MTPLREAWQGGLHELADAANVGFQVYGEKILVPDETRKICQHFDVDPLQLISSGSLLVVAEEAKTAEILSSLSRNGVQASMIGEVVAPELGRTLVKEAGEETELVRPASDHLWKALAKPAKTC